MKETYLTIIDASTGKTTIVKGKFKDLEGAENFMYNKLKLNVSDCEYILTQELDLDLLGLEVKQ